MSIICAAKKNGIIAISSDTQSNFGSLAVSAKHMKSSGKLYPVNQSIMGVVGWHAISDILQHLILTEEKLFQLNSKMEIFSTLISLHKKMKENYFLETKEDDDDQPVESNQLDALIVNKQGLFEISSYREVNEYNTFWAIGSGWRLALGAMHALYETEATAKTIVEAGAAAAAEYDDACGLPLHTLTLKLALTESE
jgi:ATP-dependent protease HslVU (ClpYQ) peptidase subunit